MTILERARHLLACPDGCAGDLAPSAGSLVCTACRAVYPVRGPIVDFIPAIGRSSGLAQRVMEYAWVARIYEEHWRPWFTSLGGPLDYATEEQWLRQHLRPDATGAALDLACGTGRYARLLAGGHPDRVVIGVDLSLPMLEEAARAAAAQGVTNILFVRALADRLPLREASMTALNCFGALHLFPDAGRAIGELARVAGDEALFTCFTARKYSRAGMGPIHRAFSSLASFEFFAEPRLTGQLARAGFVGYSPTYFDTLLLFHAQRQRRAPAGA